MHGIVGRAFSFSRGSLRVRGIGAGGIGRSLSLGDAGLGALVGVLDGAVVGGGLVVQLVGLVDQRSGLLADVVLGCAARESGEGNRQDRNVQSSHALHSHVAILFSRFRVLCAVVS